MPETIVGTFANTSRPLGRPMSRLSPCARLSRQGMSGGSSAAGPSRRSYTVAVFLILVACKDAPTPPTEPKEPAAEALPPTSATIDEVTFAELTGFVPETLLGVPRDDVTALGEEVLNARFVGEGKDITLNLNLVDDPDWTHRFYQARYQTRDQGGFRIHVRHWTLPDGQKTAEACTVLRDRVNACIALSPGTTDDDAVPFLLALDLARLDARAEGRTRTDSGRAR